MTGRAYQTVQRNFGSKGYIYQLDIGDGFTGVYCETCQIVYFKCVWFVVCILYYSKTGSKIMFRSGITKCE